MDFMLLLYALGLWLLFVVLAIINGSIRNSVYGPKLGEHKGHVVSSVIAVCYILVVTYFFVSGLKNMATQTDWFLVGALWLAITVVFEFGFGHYVVGHSWRHLIADYNIFKGRLWSLVLLTTFLSPIVWGFIVS